MKGARVIRQPGDGSCLFHSLRHGLKRANPSASVPGGAEGLRRELSNWIFKNGAHRIADTPVKDWVLWDSRCNVKK